MATDPSEAAQFVTLAAQAIADRQVLFVGIGVPSLAAMAAKRLHAPNCVLVYESGAVDAMPPVPPLSTGSPSVAADTAMLASCLSVFSMLQQGRFDVGLLSGAQVDRFGNLNSTVLGSYRNPKVRLVGSGGAHDIAALARHVIIMMPHDPRRFVERVDFNTSPGVRTAANRLKPESLRGGGPTRLVTPRGLFSFETGELTLEAVAHGLDEEDALEGIGWSVPRSRDLRELAPIESHALAVANDLLAAWGRGIA